MLTADLPALEPLVPIPLQKGMESRVVVAAGADSLTHPLVVQSLAAHAARGERLGVLVGHNRLDVYGIARLVAEHGLDPAVILARIELSRAFTCHQLHRRIITLTERDAWRWSMLYVLGLLDTFYDEDVKYPEVSRLLVESLARLRQLAAAGLPVLVTASAPKEPGRERLLGLVAERADVYW